MSQPVLWTETEVTTVLGAEGWEGLTPRQGEGPTWGPWELNLRAAAEEGGKGLSSQKQQDHGRVGPAGVTDWNISVT